MMGFQKSDNTKVIPLVAENFTNAICFGQTGSGKTTSFVLPNIKNRIAMGHGVLIYDFKGNIHLHVKKIVEELGISKNIHEIGKPWGRKIDLLDGISSRGIEALFDASGSKHHDTYWSNSARDLFENLYKLITFINITLEQLEPIETFKHDSYIPTIKNIYRFIHSPEALVKFFVSVRKLKLHIEKAIANYLMENVDDNTLNDTKHLNILLNNLENINKYFELLAEYHEMKSNGETSGKNGVLNVLNSTFINIAENDYFSENSFDIVSSLDHGDVVIINVQDMNNSVLNMLNTTIYQKLYARTSLKHKKPITIFIDEAQKVLSPNYIPDVDICRENKFEYIFATQDKSLLENLLGEDTVYALLRNIVEQYTFKTTDKEDTSTTLYPFEYLNLINNVRRFAEPVFYTDDELFEVEFKYLNSVNAFSLVDITSEQDFIIKYNHALIQHNKVILSYRNGEEEVVELNNYKDLLSDFINKVHNLQKEDLFMERLAHDYEVHMEEENNNAPTMKRIVSHIKELDKYKSAVSYVVEDIKRLKTEVSGIKTKIEELSFKKSF